VIAEALLTRVHDVHPSLSVDFALLFQHELLVETASIDDFASLCGCRLKERERERGKGKRRRLIE
jgi:hypothetical protein